MSCTCLWHWQILLYYKIWKSSYQHKHVNNSLPTFSNSKDSKWTREPRPVQTTWTQPPLHFYLLWAIYKIRILHFYLLWAIYKIRILHFYLLWAIYKIRITRVQFTLHYARHYFVLKCKTWALYTAVIMTSFSCTLGSSTRVLRT